MAVGESGQITKMDFFGKTVVLVDDDVDVLDSTRILLESYGAQVLTYESVFCFLEQMPESHCLIVDFDMPEMNGLAVIAELHRRKNCTPLMILTAVNDPTLERRATELGVGTVVHKTIGPVAVLEAAHSLLGGS